MASTKKPALDESDEGSALDDLGALHAERHRFEPDLRRIVERLHARVTLVVGADDEPEHEGTLARDPTLRLVRHRPGRHDRKKYVPAGYGLHGVPKDDWIRWLGKKRRYGKPGMLVRLKPPATKAAAETLARDAAANILGTLEPRVKSAGAWPADEIAALHAAHKLLCGFDLRENNFWAKEFADALRRWVEHREEGRLLDDAGREIRSSFRPNQAFADWLVQVLGAPVGVDIALFERAIRECSLGGRGHGPSPERWVEKFQASGKKKRAKAGR